MKPGLYVACAVRNRWRWRLPPWPVVPPRLWLTGAAIGLLALSLVFKQELWPSHPRADFWCWALLLLLVPVGGGQTILVLRAWSGAYAGPGWLRGLLRGVVFVAGIGMAILLLLLFVLGCLLLLMGPRE